LLTAEQLHAGVRQLAEQVQQCYGHQPVTIIGVLTGSVVLMADLIRQLDMPLRVGVVQTSSYRGTERGPLSINAELMPDIRDRQVLLIDDIFDTGHTLKEVVKLMRPIEGR